MSHDDSRDRAGLIFHDVSKCDLKPGDHIYCYRNVGIYNHHGIYIGEEDCKVIHLSGSMKVWILFYYSKQQYFFFFQKKFDSPSIRSCTLEEFLEGAQLRLVAYDASFLEARFKRGEAVHTMKCDPASVVIGRAKYYLDNPEEWADYNLVLNNCETFAVYCKTNVRISKQTFRGIVGDTVGRTSRFLLEIGL